MWSYFLPAIQRAKEWADSGRIGKTLHVKSSFGYPVPFDANSRYYDPNLAGGSLYDMGIYNIVMDTLFVGKTPNNIENRVHHAATGVDDDTISIRYYDDCISFLHSAFRCKLNNHLYIIGEKGYIDIPDFWRARECFLYEGEKAIEHFQDRRKGNGFEYEITAVSEDILQGNKESETIPSTPKPGMAEDFGGCIKR